jgi:hypothetical protein
MNIILSTVILIACVGCARFSTKQTDLSYDTNGKPQRQITTKAAGTTFFSAKATLASWKASQTDKTQGANVGNMNLESSDTNVVRIVDAVIGAAIKAAAKP